MKLRKLVQGGDVVLLPQGTNLPGGQAGEAQQGRQALGNRAFQLIVIAEPAAVQEFPDFPRQCLADAGNVLEAAAPRHGLQALVQGQKLLRGAPVGADAKRVVAPQVQEVGDVVKDGADVVLVHRIRHLVSTSCRRCQNATTSPTTSRAGGVRLEAATASPISDSGAESSAWCG